MNLWLLLAAAISAPHPDSAWRCDFTKKEQCSAETGCQPATPAVWLIVYPEYKLYQRCDRSGCDSYTASFVESGRFLIASLPANGAFLKVSSDLQATEVASLGHTTLISHGKCADTAPPPIITPAR